MKLYSQDDILDPKIRAAIIKEIKLPNNLRRKTEAKKRHEVMRDNTVKYVLKKLQNEGLSPETLTLMQNRASNISICKKIINKLARAYTNGCTRETGEKFLDSQVSHLSMLIDMNKTMKKTDKFLRLQRNCLLWFMPDECEPGKFIIKSKVMGPWQYDAVENSKDPERPLAIVLSDYYDPQNASTIKGGRNQVSYTDSEATQWQPDGGTVSEGPGVQKMDDPNKTYIFWSDKYHFTTDNKGEIIAALSPEGYLNPIGELPGVAAAKERDDEFWAAGGEDLVDGSILINTMLTDMNAILFMQGWGQMVITGPRGSVSKEVKTGPHRAMVLTYNPKKGEQKPEVTVISSNPPIQSWMQAVEQFAALLLSTNNLAPSTVAGKLGTPANLPSGIAMMIDKSESTEDITETQDELSRIERRAWKILGKWQNLYYETGALDDDFKSAGKLPESEKLEVTTKFHTGEEVVSESERLDNMKKKKDLGIVRQIELIMEENPSMTEEEATAKLMQIRTDRLAEATIMAAEMANSMVNQNKQSQNGNQPQNNGGA